MLLTRGVAMLGNFFFGGFSFRIVRNLKPLLGFLSGKNGDSKVMQVGIAADGTQI